MNKATTGTMIGLAMLANTALAGGEQAQERHPLRAFEELSPKILEIHERANEIDKRCGAYRNTDLFNQCVTAYREEQKYIAEQEAALKNGDRSSHVKAITDALKANQNQSTKNKSTLKHRNTPTLDGSALFPSIDKCPDQLNAGRERGKAPVFDIFYK